MEQGCVEVNGERFHVTGHARKRFNERRGYPLTTHVATIVRLCLDDPNSVWVPDKDGDGWWLVTVLPEPKGHPPNELRYRKRKGRKHK